MGATPASLERARAAGLGAGVPTPYDRSLAGGPTGTAGVLEATMQIPQGTDFHMQRAFIFSNSTSPTNVTVYVGDVAPENRRSYSDEGDLNEAEWQQPIWVPAGAVLRFRWEGGTAPAGGVFQAFANVQGLLVPVR